MHRFHRAVQPDEVTDVGVQSTGFVSDLVKETHRAIAGPDIGVLIREIRA